MFQLSRKYLVLLALPVLFWGCQKPTPVSAEKPVQAKEEAAPLPPGEAVPADRTIDDTARFLAGMPGTPGSAFAALESNPAWQEHRKVMDAAWATADDKLIKGLHEFQHRELEVSPLDKAVLFYPFSGPDALTATICFPKSPKFVMVALEPAGTLPTAAQLAKKPMAEYLAAVRETVASELGRSFFITREMDRQFRGQVTDGLLVPTLLLLVRTDHTVLGLKFVRIDEKGSIAERPAGKSVEAKYANKGFELEFRTDTDKSLHNLYYFSLNLDDLHVKQNDGFLKYVADLPSPTTMLKSTSYMTHHPEFSAIRDLVVKQSGAIFQDDSGIPYKYFTPADWKVQLYGEYIQPYGSFKWLVQKDLRKAYTTETVKPLTLRLGYGFGKVTSNLLLAKKIHATP